MAYDVAGSGLDLRGPDPSGSAAPDFTTMCASHRARVLGLCRRLLRSDIEAEDALQEVMLRAFRAWPRFRTGTDPWPWLAAITANVCRDAGRRTMRAAAYAATAEAEADAAEATVPDAYDEVERRGRCELVRAAMATVPPAYRTPLYLRDIEGWSVSDIARLRGRTVPSVRSSLTRARKLLLERVEELVKTRKEWSLPAMLPVVGRLRSGAATLRAGADRAAVGGWSSMDAVATTIGTGRLRGWPELAAATMAAAAAFTMGGSGAVAGSGDAAATALSASRPPALVAVAPAEPASAAAATGAPSVLAPAPPRPGAAIVAIGDAELSGDRTATPTLTAPSGETPLPPEAGQGETRIGLVAYDCRKVDGVACQAVDVLFADR